MVLLQSLQNLRLRVTLAWSSPVGDLACRTVVCLMLGLQNRVLLDVVGFFVGLGGETVLGCLEDVVTDVLDLLP